MRFLKNLYPMVIIATIMGGLLALTYGSLKPALDASDTREFERSLREVYPSFSRYEEKKSAEKRYYVLYEGEAAVAFVFRASFPGYGGPVETLTAVTNGVVARIVVMSMPSETPGLGTKAKNPQWLNQYLGRGVDGVPVTKSQFKEKGCDAVAGATISSLAVTRGIHEALMLYHEIMGHTNNHETITSATTTKEEKK